MSVIEYRTPAELANVPPHIVDDLCREQQRQQRKNANNYRRYSMEMIAHINVDGVGYSEEGGWHFLRSAGPRVSYLSIRIPNRLANWYADVYYWVRYRKVAA